MNQDIGNASWEIRPIARMESDFHEKFGIPRQAGVIPELRSRVVFEPEYANPDAVRGISAFSHLWLVFGFSQNRIRPGDRWAPLIRPPRLGGKTKVGVFATRSPYRPNSLGLSSVHLLSVDEAKPGRVVLTVSGADLLNGTPIFDIKPYLPYADCHPDAEEGFAPAKWEKLEVVFPDELLGRVEGEKREALLHVLEQDPRGAYEKRPDYLYGMRFGESDIRFSVENGILTVRDVRRASEEHVK